MRWDDILLIRLEKNSLLVTAVASGHSCAVNLLRIGIGGPVGSGKTMLVLRLCEWLRNDFSLAVVTNDIYTREDAEFLVRNEALTAERVIGVETGGCPHTAIRDDTSMNLAAIAELEKRHPDAQLILV